MPKYIIKHTPVLHGAEKAKQTTRFEVGDVIELAEKDAQKLGDNVSLIKDEVKEPAGKGAAGKKTAPDSGGDPDEKEKAPADGRTDGGEGDDIEAGKEKEKKK